jgi:hypothetical protein
VCECVRVGGWVSGWVWVCVCVCVCVCVWVGVWVGGWVLVLWNFIKVGTSEHHVR